MRPADSSPRCVAGLAGLRNGSSVHARFPRASRTRKLSVVQGLAIHNGGREHHETLLSGVRSRDRSKVELLASLTPLSHMPRAWHAAGSLEAGDEVFRRCSWLPFDFCDGGLLSRLGPGFRSQARKSLSVRSRLVDTLRCALPLQAPLTCTSRLSCLSSDRRESH